MLAPPPPLGLSNPPPGRPLRPLIARSRPACRARHPHGSGRASARPAHRSSRRNRLHRRPRALGHRHPARPLTLPDPVRDRLVITPASAAAARSEPARSYASRISITSSGFFTGRPPTRLDNQDARDTDRSGQNRWGETWPPMGRNSGRQWGIPVAASGEIPMAAVRLGGWLSLAPMLRPKRYARAGKVAGRRGARAVTASLENIDGVVHHRLVVSCVLVARVPELGVGLL